MKFLSKKKLLIVLLTVWGFQGFSQDLPIYNNYYYNPFFYNPSYSNSKQRAELSLLYRQQWTGINGAPKFSFLTLTAPLSQKMGIGLNIYNTVRGVITTTSAQASLSYKVMFTQQTYLSFGLSGGAGRNSLDVNQVDATDPTIARLLSSSFFLEGQAGLNFKHKNLNIAISMPEIFDRSTTDANSLQKVGISPLNTTVVSAGYKFQISPTISIQPLVLSKITTNTTQWVGYGIAYYKDFLWLGGLYRQNYGAAAILGFNINQALHFGYSYEFATSAVQNSQLAFNTHEIQVSLRFGQELKAAKVPPKKQSNYTVPRTNHYIKSHRRKY
jgi:type IX secretion system PorP/SprF family membrane protein